MNRERLIGDIQVNNKYIRCILSLSQAFLNNTELKIFGRHRESNPGLHA